MPIDPNQVQWDDAPLPVPSSAGGIDVNAVQWDDSPVVPQPAPPVSPPQPKLRVPSYSRPMEGVRSALRGLTIGTSDMLGAGIATGAALARQAATGEGDQTAGEIYRDIRGDLSATRNQYQEDNPVEALGLEIAGGVAPLIAAAPAVAGKLAGVGITQGAGRAAPVVAALGKAGEAVKALPYVGKVAQKVGQGMAIGGVYGGSQADVGSELEGAALGAGTGALAQYGIDKVIGTGGRVVGAAQKKGAELAQQYLQQNPTNVYNTVKVILKDGGIDFTKLGADVQDDVVNYAAKALAAGEKPENVIAIANKAVLERLPKPIKATQGTLNRNYLQQEAEGQIATGSPTFGGEVRSVLENYGPALRENLDILKQRTGGADVSKGQTGKAVQGFTQKAAEKSKAGYKKLYDEAEQKVGDTPVLLGTQQAGKVAGTKVDPITNTVIEKPAQAVSASNNSAVDWLLAHKGEPGVDQLLITAKNLGAIVERKGKNGEMILESAPIALKKLKDLRSFASNMQKNLDQSAYSGGEFKKLVDNVIEEHGGDLYQKAAQARRAHALQFESGPRVISDMLVSKSRSETDKALNFDSVVDNVVLSGSRGADDIKKLFNFLVKDKETRAEGLQRIKDLRAATLDHIYQQATSGQGGVNTFSSHKLNQAIKAIGGQEKLDMLLGKAGAAELRNFRQSADILLNKEKSVLPGSPTAERLTRLLDGAFNKLRTMPYGLGTTAEIVQKAGTSVRNASTARNAMMPIDSTSSTNLNRIGVNALIGSREAEAARQAAIIANTRGNSTERKTPTYGIIGRDANGEPVYGVIE